MAKALERHARHGLLTQKIQDRCEAAISFLL
jgi:hypothetical protein